MSPSNRASRHFLWCLFLLGCGDNPVEATEAAATELEQPLASTPVPPAPEEVQEMTVPPAPTQRADEIARAVLASKYGVNVSPEAFADPFGRSMPVELDREHEVALKQNLQSVGALLEGVMAERQDLGHRWGKMTMESGEFSTSALVTNILRDGAKDRVVVRETQPPKLSDGNPRTHNPVGLDRLPQRAYTRTEPLPPEQAQALLEELATLWKAINRVDVSTWPTLPYGSPNEMLRRLD